MEMIFVLLFLGLTCGICVQLFAASYTARQNARESDHIQELITDSGEILEGTDGTVDSFLALLPDGTANGSTVRYFFDKQWQSTSSENAVYEMTVTLSVSDTEKNGDILFLKHSETDEDKQIYSQAIRYPVTGAKEAD